MNNKKITNLINKSRNIYTSDQKELYRNLIRELTDALQLTNERLMLGLDKQKDNKLLADDLLKKLGYSKDDTLYGHIIYTSKNKAKLHFKVREDGSNIYYLKVDEEFDESVARAITKKLEELNE